MSFVGGSLRLKGCDTNRSKKKHKKRKQDSNNDSGSSSNDADDNRKGKRFANETQRLKNSYNIESSIEDKPADCNSDKSDNNSSSSSDNTINGGSSNDSKTSCSSGGSSSGFAVVDNPCDDDVDTDDDADVYDIPTSVTSSRIWHRMTTSEKAFYIAREKRERKRIGDRLKYTHRERMERLNKHLASLSEHFDIPKVGPG